MNVGKRNTDLGFFLKISCLFVLMVLGFMTPKGYLNNKQNEKELSIKNKLHVNNQVDKNTKLISAE